MSTCIPNLFSLLPMWRWYRMNISSHLCIIECLSFFFLHHSIDGWFFSAGGNRQDYSLSLSSLYWMFLYFTRTIWYPSPYPTICTHLLSPQDPSYLQPPSLCLNSIPFEVSIPTWLPMRQLSPFEDHFKSVTMTFTPAYEMSFDSFIVEYEIEEHNEKYSIWNVNLWLF